MNKPKKTKKSYNNNLKHLRARSWAFTINHPLPLDFNQISHLNTNLSSFLYLCYASETGTKTGTPHLQGYLHCKLKISFSHLHSLLPRAHLEPAKASPQTNIQYCSKQGTLIEFGTVPKQGQRADFSDSLSMTNLQIRTRWPLHADKLIHNRNKVSESLLPGYDPEKVVIYLSGPSGSGKTLLANLLTGEDTDRISFSGQHIIGFSAENRSVLFDEFRHETVSLPIFLQLLDKYPARLSAKGSDVLFITKKLVITSQTPLDQLYPQIFTEDVTKQIKRRVDIYRHLTSEDIHQIGHLEAQLNLAIQHAASFSVQATNTFNQIHHLLQHKQQTPDNPSDPHNPPSH